LAKKPSNFNGLTNLKTQNWRGFRF